MALDESRDGDETFTEDGITYVVEKDLLDRVKPIKVDYVNSAFGSGFSISSSLQQAACGGSCSC
jgi:Fe-S cluster assembly iron-binding protein IscA